MCGMMTHMCVDTLSLIHISKSERGNWKATLPEIADEINIVNLTSDEVNKGLLDPVSYTHLGVTTAVKCHITRLEE